MIFAPTPVTEGQRNHMIRRWLKPFVHYYNAQRPHQALNGRTPAEEA